MIASVFMAILTPLALLAACAHLAFSEQLRRRTWSTAVAALGLLVLLGDLHGNWSRVTHLLRPLLVLSYAGAVLLSRERLRRKRAKPKSESNVMAMKRLHVTIIVLCLVLLAWTLSGHFAPGVAAELEMPLRNGTYAIASGGASVLTNPRHWLEPEQKYAVDIVKLNAFGSRARGLIPDSIESFETWHAPVYAPCRGTVAEVIDSKQDHGLGLSNAQFDPAEPYGNLVRIECDGFLVLLAHLSQGSIHVRAGQRVDVGAPVGTVGLSGNTIEPHLHMQVMARFGDRLVSVPFHVHGIFPVKNRLIFMN